VARSQHQTLGAHARPKTEAETDLAQALRELSDAHAELARRQSFTDALLETIDVGIVSCDAQGIFRVSNRAERAIFGLQSGLQGLVPDQLDSLIDVFDLSGNRLAVDDYPLMRTLRGDDVSQVDVLVGPTGGPYREVLVRGTQLIGEDGEVLGAVAALTDVTAERTASRELADERRKLTEAQNAALLAKGFLDAVLTATPDYTFVTDVATGAMIYGSRDNDMLGISSAQLAALTPEEIAALLHPDDRLRLRAVHDSAAELEDGQLLQLRYRARHSDGQWRWLNVRLTPFRRSDEGTVIEVLGVVRDVTDLVQAEERLTHATLHDDLTGLPNRALLVNRLDAALARSGRDGLEVAVLFCDLDGFKNVNDTGGHAAGDAVLLEVARRLSNALREGDTVARVGGDEFVILVEPWGHHGAGKHNAAPDASPEPDRALAVRLAERVCAALRPPVSVNGVDHVVTASIGITYTLLDSTDRAGRATADEVLQDADAAMYRAKNLGKDRFEVFEQA
jgi:PAS domain S-box-containing protein